MVPKRAVDRLQLRMIRLVFAKVAVLAFGLFQLSGSLTSGVEVSFCGQVAPLLEQHCLACHGARKAEGGYRVDSYSALLTAGESGVPPIAPNDPSSSELFRRITSQVASERMPLEKPPLETAEIQRIKTWIIEGGTYDGEHPQDPLWLAIPPVGSREAPLRGPHPVPVSALAFSRDASRIFAGGYHSLTEWDVATGALVRRIPNMQERILAFSIESDGKRMAVAGGSPGRNGDVRIIDLISGEILQVVARAPDVVWDVAFRPGAQQLAVAHSDSTLQVIHTDTWEVVRTIAGHADWVMAVAWCDDGSKLASASRDKTAKIFDAESGEQLACFRDHEGPVRGIAFLPDGSHAVSVGEDGKLYRWECASGNSVAEASLAGEPARLVRTGSGVWIPESNHQIQFFEFQANTMTGNLAGHKDWVLAAAFHQDSALLASASHDAELKIWNGNDQSLVKGWSVSEPKQDEVDP